MSLGLGLANVILVSLVVRTVRARETRRRSLLVGEVALCCVAVFGLSRPGSDRVGYLQSDEREAGGLQKMTGARERRARGSGACTCFTVGSDAVSSTRRVSRRVRDRGEGHSLLLA